MKKLFSLFLLAMMICSASAFAEEWDTPAATDTQKKEDKAAVARNLAALAKKPEALRAAANIAKIRMKQKEDAKRAAEAGLN